MEHLSHEDKLDGFLVYDRFQVEKTRSKLIIEATDFDDWFDQKCVVYRAKAQQIWRLGIKLSRADSYGTVGNEYVFNIPTHAYSVTTRLFRTHYNSTSECQLQILPWLSSERFPRVRIYHNWNICLMKEKWMDF